MSHENNQDIDHTATSNQESAPATLSKSATPKHKDALFDGLSIFGDSQIIWLGVIVFIVLVALTQGLSALGL